MKNILIIDYCNYVDYQIGGHLSFCRNLLSAFGDVLTLIGITTEKNEPVGRWFRKTIDGVTYDYFALARYNKLKIKNLIPDRLACFMLILFYKKKILKKSFNNVFVQRQEIIPAIKNFHFQNVCYLFPTLENPLMISKYWYGKYFARLFDKHFFSSLRKVNLIIANGDDNAIEEMVIRSKGVIQKKSVVKFPIRINTKIFHPVDKSYARNALNIPESIVMIVTTGRLAWFKGWQFMIDCFKSFETTVPDSYLYIVGEGEDREKIIEYATRSNIRDKVILPGGMKPDQISLFLNASDIFIMGSYKEGWSTALSEAISCGTPSVVTNFSSADSIIVEHRNGFVIKDHNVDLFIQGMLKAINLPRPVYNENITLFSTERLKDDILKLWNLS